MTEALEAFRGFRVLVRERFGLRVLVHGRFGSRGFGAWGISPPGYQPTGVSAHRGISPPGYQPTGFRFTGSSPLVL
jgi:hypothetical protein